MGPARYDPTYRALLVANWTFPADARLARLVGPENDVRILQEALSDGDVGLFDPAYVETMAELSIGELMPAVEEFFVDATSRDTRLFYFSGHGRLDQRDELFLCNRTTRVDRPFATALKSSDLRHLIERSAATCIVVLDCCYSGKFKGGPVPRQLTGRARGTFAITASRASELAEDAHAPDHASVFTRHLVGGLRDQDIPGREGLLSLEDLYVAVDKSMRSAGGQQPQKLFRGAGIPPIARRPVEIAPPPPPPPEPLRLSTDRIDLGVIAHDEILPAERVAVLGVETDTDWEVEASDAWIAVTCHGGDILIAPTPAIGLSRANVYVRDLRTRHVATIRIRVERKPPAEPETTPAEIAPELTPTTAPPRAESEPRGAAPPEPSVSQPTTQMGRGWSSRVGWDFEDEDPHVDARGESVEGAPAVEVSDDFLSNEWMDAFIAGRNERTPAGWCVDRIWGLQIDGATQQSFEFTTAGGLISAWERVVGGWYLSSFPPAAQRLSPHELRAALEGRRGVAGGSPLEAFCGDMNAPHVHLDGPTGDGADAGYTTEPWSAVENPTPAEAVELGATRPGGHAPIQPGAQTRPVGQPRMAPEFERLFEEAFGPSPAPAPGSATIGEQARSAEIRPPPASTPPVPAKAKASPLWVPPVSNWRWTLRDSLWLLCTLPVGFTTWAGFLYVGRRAKHRIWTWTGAAYGVLAAGLLAFILLAIPKEADGKVDIDTWQNNVAPAATFVLWLGGIAHGLIVNIEWLKRRASTRQVGAVGPA